MKRKKKNRLDLSTAISIASLIMTITSMVWIGGFRMSTLIHEVEDLKEDMKEVKTEIKEMKSELKEMRTDLHKIDLRVAAVEQHCP